MPDWPDGWWTLTEPDDEESPDPKHLNLTKRCTSSQILQAADGAFTTSISIPTNRTGKQENTTILNQNHVCRLNISNCLLIFRN